MPKKNTIGVRISPDHAAVAVIWLRENGFLNAATHPHPIAKRVAALMKRLRKISKAKRSTGSSKAVEIAFDRDEASFFLALIDYLSEHDVHHQAFASPVSWIRVGLCLALSRKPGAPELKGAALKRAVERARTNELNPRHWERLRKRWKAEEVFRARHGVLVTLAEGLYVAPKPS